MDKVGIKVIKEADKNCGNCDGNGTPTCDYCSRASHTRRGSDHWNLKPSGDLELTVRCTTCNHVNKHKELIKGVQCSQCRTDLSRELF